MDPRPEIPDRASSIDSRLALARRLKLERQYQRSLEVLDEMLRVEPEHPAARLERARVFRRCGPAVAAAQAYAEVLDLDPENEEAAYFHALSRNRTPSRIPPILVVELFDAYCDAYETHLDELRYGVPEEVREALDQVAARPGSSFTPPWNVADLGCGTGLCGRRLRDAASRLAGVDLAPAMVERAEALGIYDELRVDDLLDFLRTGETYELLVAADVFNYLGDLGPVLDACAGALGREGRVAFTTEAAPEGDPFVLSAAGRFIHSRRHVEESARAAGLHIELHREVEGRREADRPVTFHLHVMRNTR